MAEDLRTVAGRTAREAPVLARVHRLQPDVLPAAHARADGDAPAELHVLAPRALGGVQPDVLDRIRHHGDRVPGVCCERREDGSIRPARRERPVDRRHAGVVHELAAARAQFRPRAIRDERAAASRPEAPPGACGCGRLVRGPGSG